MGLLQTNDKQSMNQSQTMNIAPLASFSTAIADKTHLANLITMLKSELATVNALLKTKEEDYVELNTLLNRRNNELLDANKRYKLLEKQYAIDCETVIYFCV